MIDHRRLDMWKPTTERSLRSLLCRDLNVPRYYFNVGHLGYGQDEDGTELPDLSAARREAIVFGGHMMAEHPEDIISVGVWAMTVTDDRGVPLFRMTLRVEDA